jgi:transcriptional regulator with XRE-family HTH domain
MPKKQTPMSVQIGNRLRQLRLAKGFEKIRHWADELGVNEDRYDKWEKGKATVPPDVVHNLKVRFGVTSDWLYFGDESGLPQALYSELRNAA